MPAEKPEECLHLFDKACAGTTSFFMSEAKSFAGWLLDHGIKHGYEFYKMQLQLLNWLRPGRQWVLKWPYHLWHLETLLDTFPDAIIIHLHRDPCQAIPSVCSLAAAARAPFCESIDSAALGEFWLNYYAAGLERGLKTRHKFGRSRIIDIRYPDLKADPLSVIRQIQMIINLDTLLVEFNTRIFQTQVLWLKHQLYFAKQEQQVASDFHFQQVSIILGCWKNVAMRL